MAADLAELLRRLRSGEPGAADAVAEAARPELMRLARARVRNPALVDDVVQEALLEVLATHVALRDPAAMRTWLRLIVHKQADRATRRIRPSLALDQIPEFPDRGDTPEHLVDRRGDVATIRLGLAIVRDADALLLRLRYFGEWTDAELAALVGAPPGTVRKRIHAARRRLRAALETLSETPPRSLPEEPMPALEQLFGRVVRPDEVPVVEPTTLTPSGIRLETELKVLDAVLPVELGGTVDLLGPAGLGQLVLVAEIATHINAVVVAAGADNYFVGLVADDLGAQAVVVDGEPAEAGRAADRLAGALARSGRTVLLVVDAVTWDAHAPESGIISEGVGSITAFRFAPHPRDGEPLATLDGAGTSIVYSTDLFVNGLHPAIDVLASRSALVEEARLDPITLGAARAAREALSKAHEVRTFLTQSLVVAEPHTGVPGEQVPARTATEDLAALVR